MGMDSSKNRETLNDLKTGSLDFLIKLLPRNHLYHGLALLELSPQYSLERMKPIPLIIRKNQPLRADSGELSENDFSLSFLMKMMEKSHGENEMECAILERQSLFGIGHNRGMKMRFLASLHSPLHHMKREVAAHQRESVIEKKAGKSSIAAGEV